ncbi:MAG: glycosyltransferase family 1 protein [Chloroflexota bacterium]
MKPLVDINAHLLSGEAGYRRAGIHQYIFQVLANLPEDAFEYHVHTRYSELENGRSHLTKINSSLPTEKRLTRILWEQTIWPFHLIKTRPALVHGMAFATPWLASSPTVVTIYDLSFLHFPGQFPKLQQFYLATQARLACQRAKRVITISESTRQDVHRYFDIPLDRIDVVFPGVDVVYQPYPQTAVSQFKAEKGINGRYILHVGTLQPRKNIPTLLDAFAKLNEPDVQLLLIGGKGWLFEEIFAKVKLLNLEDNVTFTGYVPDEELPMWYAAADLLAFSSNYEGFGMPIIEAMACGTPVVASNSSSIPEAVGEAGLLFNTFDAENLAECMVNVLQNSELSDKMRQLGFAQAKKFSWARAGRETAVSYQKAVQEL